MPTTTPNLGLFKRDPLTEGNHYFNIQEQINDPLDVIDDKVGGELVAKPPHSVTLTNGTQIVEASRTSRFQNIRMQGRTLVNLLGRDGNCENTDGFNVANTTIELVTNHYAVGTNSIKFTALSNGSMSASISSSSNHFTIPDSNKYYLAVCMLKNGTVRNGPYLVVQGIDASLNKVGNKILDTTNFQYSYCTIEPSDLTGMTSFRIYAYADNDTLSGEYAYVDAIRLYEISAAEKSFIDNLSVSEAQTYIATNYPYVDDMKHVNAVYVQNPGKNLLPPFTESFSAGGSSTIQSPYEFVVNAVAAFEGMYYEVNVARNTEMTLSAIHNGWIGAFKTDGVTALNLGGYKSEPQITFHTGDNEKIRVYFVSSGAGTFSFANPCLNVGSEALPFEPQQSSYLYLPDVNLCSNVDGSVADELYTDGEGKPRAVRRFREVVLDGSLNWIFIGDYAGFKTVSVTNGLGSNYLAGSLIDSVKFDGTILNNSSSTTSGPDRLNAGGLNHINVSIADTDSGWGESYTPTAEEIKAYFYGWQMYILGDPDYAPYNGTGTKAWVDRAKTYTVTTVPDSFPKSVYTPYRLMYQLAQPVDEAVKYEGELMLQDGANQIEAGSGVVIREAVVPTLFSGVYRIADSSTGTSLHYRNADFVAIYEEGKVFKKWRKDTVNPQGKYRALIEAPNYDPMKSYTVTYFTSDNYTLGIAPLSISGECVPNIKEAVEDLTRGLSQAKAQLSVLQITKDDKNKVPRKWISATILNGWTGTLHYRINDVGQLEIKFTITSGIINNLTIIAVLPEGYRPSAAIPLSALKVTSGDTINGCYYLDSEGRFRVTAGPSNLESSTTYQGAVTIVR